MDGLRLTMVGVRRSSCRPSPPRIIVLPVSIMTTLESRKPMLLIVLSVVDAFDGICAGVRVGWAWACGVSGTHKHQPTTTKRGSSPGRGRASRVH